MPRRGPNDNPQREEKEETQERVIQEPVLDVDQQDETEVLTFEENEIEEQ